MRREDGAVIVWVVMAMTVIFGAAAMSIDAGSLWNARRNMITATDAAALAAAAGYGEGINGCSEYAVSRVAANTQPAQSLVGWQVAELEGCDFQPHPSGIPQLGFVTVDAARDVDLIFGPVLGVSQGTVRSTTAAEVGFPLAVGRVRPLALCVKNSALQQWLANKDNSLHTIPLEMSGECGGTPGTRNLLNFRGGNQDPKPFWQDIQVGYPELIPRAPGVLDPKVGWSWQQLENELNQLLGTTFFVVVYEKVDGCGASAEFHIVDFVNVELVGVDFKMEKAKKDESWIPPGHDKNDKSGCASVPDHVAGSANLQVRFRRALVSGTCCGPVTGLDLGARSMRICAVSPDTATAANCISD
jgi:hypothetical protein